MEKIFNEDNGKPNKKTVFNEEYKTDDLDLDENLFKRNPLKKQKEEKQKSDENEEVSEIQDNSELDELNKGEE